MNDELREVVARAICDAAKRQNAVRYSFLDFESGRHTARIDGDIDLARMVEAALAAIEAAGYAVVKFRVEPGPSLFDEPSENGDEVRG